MFRFTQEPSSRSYNQCLAKITGIVQQCASVHTLSVLHLPDGGSCVNRNMLERLL